jgi:hypothetical protein
MKYKFSIVLPYFGYTLTTKYRNLAILLFFISTRSTIENLENDLNAKFLIFNFFFWRNFASREKKGCFWQPKKNPTFLDFGGKNVPKAF